MSLNDNFLFDENVNNALSTYASILLEWKEHFNLTAAKDLDEIEKFHIRDSLLPFAIINSEVKKRCENAKDSVTFADLGTGAGLPLIPLVIAFSEYSYPLSFYAIDRSLKRCTFLKNTVNILKSKNLIKNDIKIINNDISSIKEKFDIITFRAFTNLKEVEKSIRKLLKDDGIVFAYKGKYETSIKESESLSCFSAKIEQLPPLENRERSLMILRPL